MKWKLESAMVSGCSLWPLKARGQICPHWGVQRTWGAPPGTQGVMNQHLALGRCRAAGEVLWKLKLEKVQWCHQSSWPGGEWILQGNMNLWGKPQRANQRFVEKSCSCLRHVSVRRQWVAALRTAARRASFAVCFAAVWVCAAPVMHSTTSSLRPSHFTTTSPVFFCRMKHPCTLGEKWVIFRLTKAMAFPSHLGGHPSYLFLLIHSAFPI